MDVSFQDVNVTTKEKVASWSNNTPILKKKTGNDDVSRCERRYWSKIDQLFRHALSIREKENKRKCFYTSKRFHMGHDRVVAQREEPNRTQAASVVTKLVSAQWRGLMYWFFLIFCDFFVRFCKIFLETIFGFLLVHSSAQSTRKEFSRNFHTRFVLLRTIE